jgi:hypothetical protein
MFSTQTTYPTRWTALPNRILQAAYVFLATDVAMARGRTVAATVAKPFARAAWPYT